MMDARDAGVAAALRDARAAAAMTQDELAGAAAVGIATVKRAEAGSPIQAQTLKSLCSVLGLDAAALLAGRTVPPPAAPGSPAERLPASPGGPMRWFPVESVAYQIGHTATIMWAATFFLACPGHPPWPLLPGGLVSFAAAYLALSGFFHTRLASPAPPRDFRAVQRVSSCKWAIALSAFSLPAILWAADSWNEANMLVVGPCISLGIGISLRMHGRSVEAAWGMARDAFERGLPGILKRLDAILAAPLTGAGRADALAAIAEARSLARGGLRDASVRVLAAMARDLENQVSGRRALADYLRVARAMEANPEERNVCLAADALDLRASGLA